MFDLIRYAAQSDHSPPRVVAPLAGVRPVEQNVRSELSRLYNHADSVNLDMFARATWSVSGWYVTAIEVRNRTKQSIEIDPSRLQHTAHGVVNGVANHFMASALIRGDVAAVLATVQRGLGSPEHDAFVTHLNPPSPDT